jgi:NitT/TauT family transport system permease protein
VLAALLLSFFPVVVNVATGFANDSGIGSVKLIAISNPNVLLVCAALLVVNVMGVGLYAVSAFLENRFTSWLVPGGGLQYATGGG